ncbi:two-component system sensor histidine kinase CreC [Photobacterium sp. GJ3]|uniref:two-component system sensor histidine kinase CreC n=1 Tax=Photobacterium sp. GJ3 TaxID=2829502 RepID=UPI001B8B021A|nr:two-component system sensor histidine kinase CreC [Photobacterium sp. GJ3]QUJ66298.1 two-component system sensor histidine kinase CreC [Photobacterium sp. GJ3]
MSRWPRIPLGIRLFILFFILVAFTAYVVSQTMVQELKPSMRQATEETLVDMAHLLAVLAEADLASGNMTQSKLTQLITTYGKREPNALIWEVGKHAINHRIYITDRQGIVVADSWQQDIGKDFSQWNDVYLTLRGQYGARSTPLDPADPASSIMHIAAPVYHNGQIIGSVTVAKANRSIQPFIDQTKRNLAFWMLLMTGLVLIVGGLLAWRINSALSKLAGYAEKMGAGEKVAKPRFRIFYEFAGLSDALEKLRSQLDGKQYVEDYVQTLTHELKSPLSAIKGASEILQMPLPEAKVTHFAGNIERESNRMQQLIEQLLELAKLEKMPQLEQVSRISFETLINPVMQSADARLSVNKSSCHLIVDNPCTIHGDQFLLQQALFNLMENALDFVRPGGRIEWRISQSDGLMAIRLFNEGPHIPDYALPRLTERFYSLPRENGAKSTGLGLNFVEQVTKLHQGELAIQNTADGVSVTLTFPSP